MAVAYEFTKPSVANYDSANDSSAQNQVAMPHILVVEDEEHLATGIKFNLEAEGYTVTHAADGSTALELFDCDAPGIDLVILDLMLPGMSGYSVCESIRDNGFQIPVLMLSARTLAEDRTRGFDVGADQYLTKPFELDELLSRVNRLLQTAGSSERAKRATTYRFGQILVKFDTLQVCVGDETHQLTALEMKLLEYFIQNEGRVISRRELLENVWERPGHLHTRAVDQFIRRLRKIIEPNPSQPTCLVTIRDAGYRFATNPD